MSEANYLRFVNPDCRFLLRLLSPAGDRWGQATTVTVQCGGTSHRLYLLIASYINPAAIFSAAARVGRLVFAQVTEGKMEASAM